MDWLLDLPSPLRSLIILPAEFGILALVLLGLKKIGVNIRDTWLQGAKNAFFVSLTIVALVGAIAMIPIQGFGESTQDRLAISFGVIWVAVFCWAYFSLFSSRQKAGQELLDVAPNQNGTIISLIGIGSIVIGLFGIADFIGNDSRFSWLRSAIIGLSCGLYFVYLGFSHIRICENGIVAFVDLIKWSKIESFEWIDHNGKAYTLKLRYKGKIPMFLRMGAVPVPTEKKSQVDAILRQYLSRITL